jgi:hypothetical protein
MDRAMWDRWAPGFGIAFVVLFLVAFFIAGESPMVGDSAEEITSFYVDDRDRVLTAIVLFGLALIAFLWFLGSLAAVLNSAGEPRLAATAFGSGLITAGMFSAVMLLTGGLAFTIAENGDAGVVQALSDLTWVGQVVISFPAAALVGATSIAALRSLILPNWLGWAGVVGALVIVLGGTTWATDGFWAPDGGFAFITLIVFLLWLLVASVLLLMRPAGAAESVRPAVPAA